MGRTERRPNGRQSGTWCARLVMVVTGAALGMLAASQTGCREAPFRVEEVVASLREDLQYDALTIRYPLDGTQFPPEIVAPTFRWNDGRSDSDAWVVMIEFADGQGRLSFPSFRTQWTPSDEHWETIKRRSLGNPAKVTILGVGRRAPSRILSAAGILISTSEDQVGAPIFYREVNLPFIEAVKDPSRIRWRFGTIDRPEQPPIVLDKLPVCGNCHSFSADGQVLGMDVDYANDKGSYAIDTVAEKMVLNKGKIITWSDYRRADGVDTFGLLSQVSPDGRYVVSTVKDLSVFVPRDNLTFSQLFFPIRGILVVYDRETETFAPLPGADDPAYVQSNPTWSPDGRYLVFARSRVHQLKNPRKLRTVLLGRDQCEEFLHEGKTFLFDLYRIPFRGGKGGEAKPLEGASHNGMSNYFPKHSPDGRWIVFCKAESFMLLQPDSQLHIIPAAGGEARRLRCNTPRMNSWHSWSPNGKWLVFSSKWNSPYTQLFLTHVDAGGQSSPPVLLSQFTNPDRAANIPEFVNTRPGAIKRIREQFVDETSYLYAGIINARQGFHEAAARDFQKALELNPKSADALIGWASSLAKQGKLEEAQARNAQAIELEPEKAEAHEGLGNVLAQEARLEEAVESFREALRIDPTLAVAHFRLGVVLLDIGRLEEATKHLAEAVRLNPDDPKAACSLGVALTRDGKPDQAVAHYRRALQLDPDFLVALLQLASIQATSDDPALRDGPQAVELATRACQLTGYEHPEALHVLAAAYAEVGRFSDAVSTAELAMRAARAAGNEDLAEAIQKLLPLYRQNTPLRLSPP